MVSEKFVISNSTGLHVRPASVLSKAAEGCTSKVEIRYKNNIINAKSLLNIVAAAISKGNEILLCCTGPNEEEDLAKLMDVLGHLED